MDNSTTHKLNLAAHFLNIERPDRTLDFLQQATVAERDSVRYSILLAAAYDKLDELDKSRQAALGGLAEYPEDGRLLRLLASAQRQLGDVVSAETTLTQALSLQPDNPALHFDAAYNAIQANNPELAAQWLASGQQLAPESRHVLRLHPLIAYKQKAWELAETACKAWIQQDLTNSDAYYLLADIYAKQGRRSLESEEQLAEAARLDPSSDAAAALRQIERRRGGCLTGLLLFCGGGGLLMALVGVIAAWQEQSAFYLLLTLFGCLAGLYMVIMVALNRQPAVLSTTGLQLGADDKAQTIPYADIRAVQNSQFGIIVRTASQTRRIVRLNQDEQATLFVNLRNRVPETHAELLSRIEQPLPFRTQGNWQVRLMQLFLLACVSLLLFTAYYAHEPGQAWQDWARTLLIVGMVGFLGCITLLWIAWTPLFVRFSAETITVRYPFKVRRHPTSQLEAVGLRRGYRLFKGQQLPNYSVDLHFRDGEVVVVDQDDVGHPPGDWSPLYELASRLQVQYGVASPQEERGKIGRYLV